MSSPLPDEERPRARVVDHSAEMRIPVLELDDGRYLSESNAILNYLATDTSYLPV